MWLAWPRHVDAACWYSTLSPAAKLPGDGRGLAARLLSDGCPVTAVPEACKRCAAPATASRPRR